MLLYTLKKTQTMQVIYILKFKINIKKNRKERKTTEQLILFASGLGDLGWVTSLGPEQAGSAGGTVLGLRALGRICQPMSHPPRWTWASCSRLHEPTVSRSRGPSCSRTNPGAPKGWRALWAGRALQSALGPVSPGGGVPTSSLLP